MQLYNICPIHLPENWLEIDFLSRFSNTFYFRKWTIVPGLSISDTARARLDATAKELIEERDAAYQECQDWRVAANL